MVIIISEKPNTKDRHPIYYRTVLDEAGNEVSKERFDCRILTVEQNGIKKICLMDSRGNLREEPTEYINRSVYSGYWAKRQVADALQLFYTFCDLYGYDPKEITIGQVTEMMNFLSGTSVRPEVGSKRTLRKAGTVNQKYAMIKKYVLSNEWRINAFMNTKNIRTKTTYGTDIEHEVNRRVDANKLKEDPMRKMTIPKHITPEQMKLIAKRMRENKDTVSLAASRLQYSYGLRSGEMLGITTEDIFQDTDNFGTTTYHIILRNRISDASYQSCKGRYHPTSPDEYGSSFYMGSKWQINISKEMYDQLQRLVRQTREYVSMSPAREKNYKEDSKADSVICYGRDNRYVFIGRNGRRLSGQTWNNILKRYFLEQNIDIDEGTKKSNCSHRLRHGFAMFHAHYAKYPMSAIQLQQAMRHASSSTCAIYYTPLQKDVDELRGKFLDELDSLIPEFDDE